MKSIGLHLPPAGTVNKATFDTSHRGIEKWLEELPRASVGNCAKILFAVLHETNTQKIGVPERTRLLEALREPVHYVNHSMLKYYLGTAFPLPKKNKKIADANREIYLKMAIGYAIAIEDLLTRSSLFLDKQMLTMLIHRALSYFIGVLITTYQIYSLIPPGVWYNIHKLYEFSERKKIHTTNITDTEIPHQKKTSIRDEYIRILLLSLSSPNHLYQGEVDNVFHNLEQWTDLAKLTTAAGNKDTEQVAVMLNSDEPPQHLKIERAVITDANFRIIDTSALLGMIDMEMQKENEDKATNTFILINKPEARLSRDLLRRLRISWGMFSKRAYARKERNTRMEITIGLSATHVAILESVYNINGGVDTHENDDSQLIRLVNAKTEYSSREVKSETDTSPDVWDMIYEQGKLQMVPSGSSQTASYLSDESSTVYCTTDSWTLSNESAGGYCIKCSANCGNSTQVGELVGLKISNNIRDSWSLGIIRWMQNYGEGGVQIGGQFIGRGAIPVGISKAFGDEGHGLQSALLIPGIKATGRPGTLITHATYYRIGHIVTLHLKLQTLKIKLLREYRETGLYSEFEYEQVLEKTVETGDESQPEAEDFNDVWKSL